MTEESCQNIFENNKRTECRKDVEKTASRRKVWEDVVKATMGLDDKDAKQKM